MSPFIELYEYLKNETAIVNSSNLKGIMRKCEEAQKGIAFQRPKTTVCSICQAPLTNEEITTISPNDYQITCFRHRKYAHCFNLINVSIDDPSEPPQKVMAAYRFPNGNVATYDWNGRQIPELQGVYSEELCQKILARSDNRSRLEGITGIPQANDLKLYSASGKSPYPFGYTIIVAAHNIAEATRIIRAWLAGQTIPNDTIDLHLELLDEPKIIYSDNGDY